MESKLTNLLSKGCILVNLYTGDKYTFIKQEDDKDFVYARIMEQEKWNKYKLIYEIEPAKDMRVPVENLIPTDKVPFLNPKGKKLFEVRNMDIVTYERNKEIIKARVIYIGEGQTDNDIVFTFVDQNGNDISDTGYGYTVQQFAQEYKKRGKAVKPLKLEGGAFAEVDRRFNTAKVEDEDLKKKAIKKIKKQDNDGPLSVPDIHRRLKKLKFGYKDGFVYTKNSVIKSIFSHEKPQFITDDFMNELISGKQMDEFEHFRYLEAYNLAKQLRVHDEKNLYQIELANIKRKGTIDVTDEEKANTASNVARLEEKMRQLDAELAKLDKYRSSIVNDLNDLIDARKSNAGTSIKADKAKKDVENHEVA